MTFYLAPVSFLQLLCRSYLLAAALKPFLISNLFPLKLERWTLLLLSLQE